MIAARPFLHDLPVTVPHARPFTCETARVGQLIRYLPDGTNFGFVCAVHGEEGFEAFMSLAGVKYFIRFYELDDRGGARFGIIADGEAT